MVGQVGQDGDVLCLSFCHISRGEAQGAGEDEEHNHDDHEDLSAEQGLAGLGFCELAVGLAAVNGEGRNHRGVVEGEDHNRNQEHQGNAHAVTRGFASNV